VSLHEGETSLTLQLTLSAKELENGEKGYYVLGYAYTRGGEDLEAVKGE
jgi:hypothetical protein